MAKHQWRTTSNHYRRFLELWRELDQLMPDSDEFMALREEVLSLPNFPYYYDPDTDLVEIFVVDQQYSHKGYMRIN